MSEKKYVDFSTVRDLLQKANDDREEQSQEQQKAMEHAEWAASDNRGSKPSNSDTFSQLFEALSDVDCISENDLLRSKMAEIRPDSPAQVRVIMAPYRIQISEGEIDQIITHVKQIT
ncbi:MAG: hypothetical protein ACJZ49_01595 [Candidatus Thalassarchaeaceae archaeon]|mgnify:FL=1|nr:MAG: hypothetical protein CMA04_002510 [Euryarchaeota archaeon]RPG76059.1 MAG: hypothetical protein CBC45_001265 [Euryarchaeota archaeon TMED85]|tara:strand:- start:5838 stop:6188 length:351 start_codon:yes stop_codon:yes gene_type:complete